MVFHILIFLELETVSDGIVVPWAQDYCDFFSEFFDVIFINFFGKIRFRHFVNYAPGRTLHRDMVPQCVIHHWIRLKKTKKMSTILMG